MLYVLSWILEAIYAALTNLETHRRLPISRRDQNKRRQSALPLKAYDLSDPLANGDAIWTIEQALEIENHNEGC